jgi:diguanylate cyclase (GGDEF)-like protein
MSALAGAAARRAVPAVLGLITASAVIVHVSGGVVEAHFHFFVMVGVITLCLAMIDLDNFKAFNDRHGHQAGDLVLKGAASIWRAQVRSTDLLVRYGGEEFALLLPACAVDDAVRIVERLRPVTPPVTCSVGLASWDFQEDASELIERADQALYAAKAEGRNRYVLAS